MMSLIGPTYYYSTVTVKNFTHKDEGNTGELVDGIQGNTSATNGLQGLGITSPTNPSNTVNNQTHFYNPPVIITITNKQPIDTNGIYIDNDIGTPYDGAKDVVVKLYGSNGALLGTETFVIPPLSAISSNYVGQVLFPSGKTYTNVAKWDFEVHSNYFNAANGGGGAASLQIQELALVGQLSPPICFVMGTMIETDQGAKPVEDLRKGDMVRTKDNGFQPILWLGSRRIKLPNNEGADRLRPVRIRAGALGAGLPAQDLLVSQQHRVLVKSRVAARMMASDEVLVPAKKLLDIDGVDLLTDSDEVTYFHFLLRHHEIVYSNGVETETLFIGPDALKAIPTESRDEVLGIFPELAEISYDDPVPARIIPSGKIAKKLVARIKKGKKPLYENLR